MNVCRRFYVALLICFNSYLSVSVNAMFKDKVPMALSTFELNQVRLLDGPCKSAQENTRKYLHFLDSDRLLYNMRKTAGLETVGNPLGGWEAPAHALRGNFVGHYLSACALMYASTGDEKLKTKNILIVTEIAKCQQAMGNGYVAGHPENELLKRLKGVGEKWSVPFYAIHKLMAGLYDTYDLCGNKEALEVLKGLAGYIKIHIDALSDSEMEAVLNIEFGGMAEVLLNLYSVTENSDYRDLAKRFEKSSFLDPLSRKVDNLYGLHANTHVPEIVGVARHYELEGKTYYKTISQYFWNRVARTRSYATGGCSVYERIPLANNLAGTLRRQNHESCVTYNMLNLTRHLLRWSADPSYVEFYQRAFFNGILSIQNPDSGMMIYSLSLAPGSKKIFSTPYDNFWCCIGTGIESFAKLGNSLYFHDEKGIYVNMFVASKVNWQAKQFQLEQVTRFPEEEKTTFLFHLESPEILDLNIFVPYWATKGVKVKINSKEVPANIVPSTYLTLNRKWIDGDKIEVEIPMELHYHAMPDDPQLVAIMYGPLVLAGFSEKKRTDYLLLGDLQNLSSWIKPMDGQRLIFHVIGQDREIKLKPINKIVDSSYIMYWKILPDETQDLVEFQERLSEKQKLSSQTVDKIIPHNKTIESNHNIQGEKTTSLPSVVGPFRKAESGGWWSWDFKVLQNSPVSLVCHYGVDSKNSETNNFVKILINNTVLAVQSLSCDNVPQELVAVEYPLPFALTKGKEQVTITFKYFGDKDSCKVYDCLILKPENKK